ncbi:hypothetical protein LXL04_039555 [Taraxacum kok-saghyz]
MSDMRSRREPGGNGGAKKKSIVKKESVAESGRRSAIWGSLRRYRSRRRKGQRRRKTDERGIRWRRRAEDWSGNQSMESNKLLMYARAATSVRCLCCHMVNLASVSNQLVQEMIIVVSNCDGNPTPIFDNDVFQTVLSAFIAASVLKLGQGVFWEIKGGGMH